MEFAVKIEKLRKSFGDIKAVDDISFNVGLGEMFGLVGPDGAGKTTTIRNLCGLIKPDSGKITLLDIDINKHKKEAQNKIGYLSQKFSLYGDLSVDENIEFFADIHGVKNYFDRRNELLEFTRLTPFRDRPADKLSGGMKQKLALACSLIHRPKILFLDEPTTGVDPVSRRDFWKILSGLIKDGITILMSTPYLDEAERCNRVALMNKGKILSLDTPQNIKKSIDREVIEIVCPEARKAYKIIKPESGFEVQLFGDRIDIVVQNSAVSLNNIIELFRQKGLLITSYRVIPPSLENVFIHLVGDNKENI
jgi:ABC-type multidrug transport system, ATPase component